MNAMNHTRTYIALGFVIFLFVLILIGYLNLLPR